MDRPPADAGPLARHLADQLLGHGPMLLVADDVATPAQLEPLEVLARQMWLLVTTSDPGLPPPGHRRVEVGALDEAAAREVLTRGLPPIDPALRARLAAATGRLPLALALSNARLAADVARGTAVDAAARRAADRLERAGPYRPGGAGGRSGILAAAIGLAAEALPPELRDRLAELGVFPADAEIPVEAAHLLWSATAGLGRDQAERVCRTLAGLALVTLRDAIRTARRWSCTTRCGIGSAPTWARGAPRSTGCWPTGPGAGGSSPRRVSCGTTSPSTSPRPAVRRS